MHTQGDTEKCYVDAEFDDDLWELANDLNHLRHGSTSISGYEKLSLSVRRAKLLLRSIKRNCSKMPDRSAKRLLMLAEAKKRVPAVSRSEFERIQTGQKRHTRELRLLCCRRSS